MSTPALALATEALDRVAESLRGQPISVVHGINTHISETEARVLAARVVATLHDPDEGRDPVAEALCSHDKSVHHMERTDDFPCSACVSAADAVRAAILGEA